MSQCYEFVYELLPDDKQSEIDFDIQKYWQDQFKEFESLLISNKINLDSFDDCKNFLMEEQDLDQYRPKIDVTDKESLLDRYKKV